MYNIKKQKYIVNKPKKRQKKEKSSSKLNHNTYLLIEDGARIRDWREFEQRERELWSLQMRKKRTKGILVGFYTTFLLMESPTKY